MKYSSNSHVRKKQYESFGLSDIYGEDDFYTRQKKFEAENLRAFWGVKKKK